MPSSCTQCPSCCSKRCSMISAWKKSNREFKGYQPLPRPPPPSTPHRSIHCPPLLVGKNAQPNSSNTNNALNNSNHSSPARRRIIVIAATAMTATVAPATLLPPRVCGPPTSTPGSTLIKCDRVPGGHSATSPVSTGYDGRRPSLRSSTVGQAALHATLHASSHPSWSVVGSSASGSRSMVPMDGLVGSIVTGQLLQHHGPGLSCDH
jgi:hypothetical protein